MKQTIKITESELKSIIKDAVNEIISERKTLNENLFGGQDLYFYEV